MMSSSSSPASATVRVEKPAVRVEKATSRLLIGPDWTMNMDICDTINNDQWQAKEVLKAIKKRLQNKNPKVQFLALTLLETMVKNCGEYVHFQVAERKILEEMIKIVKKKTDMQVRDKILVLLDSWQEAFGGPGGKYPQYYLAYIELKRSGIAFPQRSANAPPIFTPPIAQSESTSAYPQSGYGVPSVASVGFDTAMTSDTGTLSFSDFRRIRDALELLREMLQAVNPNDPGAVKDELIVELVNQCRSNQKELMELIGSTRDEKLLGEGLELNDDLQSLLARHDAIAAGIPSMPPPEASKPLPQSKKPIEPPLVISNPIEDDDEFEDDFDQLAHRNSKLKQVTSGSGTSVNSSDSLTSNRSDITTVTESSTSSSAMNNALVPIDYPLDPPPPVKVRKEEQDMIDLLSITLSTFPSSPGTPATPPSASSEHNGTPATSTGPGYSSNSYGLAASQGYAPYNSYIAPWAQQALPAPTMQPQMPQYASSRTAAHASSPRGVNMPAYSSKPLEQQNSFGSRGNGSTAAAATGVFVGETPTNTNSLPSYVLPNRLFEDLIDLRSFTGGTKTSVRSQQPMISGKK